MTYAPIPFPQRQFLQFDYHLGQHRWGGTARTGALKWETDPAGAAKITALTVEPRWDNSLFDRWHSWFPGDRTTPKLQGAIDAVQGALPSMLRDLDASRRYKPDAKWGSEYIDSFAIRDAERGGYRGSQFYGRFERSDPNRQAVVNDAAALLRDLFEAVRSETRAKVDWVPF